MRIIFLGSPTQAIPVLEEILNSKHEVVAVITQSAKPKGRGLEKSKTAVAQYAEERNLKLFEVESLREDFYQNILKKFEIDLAVVVAFGHLIPEGLLDRLKFGWMNVHFSMLPKYRGAAPVQRSILNGEKKLGITFFQIDKGLDTGPIYRQFEIDLDNQFADEAFQELNSLASKKIIELLNQIENYEITPTKQDGEASYAAKLKDNELKIDWNNEHSKILNIIRAGTSNLSAWSTFKGEKIKILNPAKIAESRLNIGQIELIDGEITVGSKDLAIKLGEVIPQGKKRMSAKSWYNGIQDKTGLKFD